MTDPIRIRTDYFDHVLTFGSLPSTNDWLKEHAWEEPDGTVAVAREQSEGRGRAGRSFLSQGALCLSVLFHDLPADLRPLMPLLCGLVVCDALGPQARLKWPNDVLVNDKKIAGILCESLHTPNSYRAVCGFGINLTQTAEFFAENDLPGATSLALEGMECDFDAVGIALLEALENRFKEALLDPSTILPAYTRKCVTPGRAVTVVTPAGERDGTALRITPDGGLSVRFRDGGVQTVYSGDVSIRAAED